MEQIEQTNPAGRLHAILSRALEHTQRSSDIPSIELWSFVFDIPLKRGGKGPLPADAVREVISRLLQLAQLIEETEESLRKIEDLPERYFRPFGRIRILPEQSLASLSSNLLGPMRAITEGDMTVLEFCSERLENQHSEPVISEDELQAILGEVNQLFDEIKSAQIDAELQTFILDGLESIRRGIYEFRIRGPERLKETIGEIVGNLYVNYKTVVAAGENESLEKFNKLFNHLSAMMTFANTSVKLLTAFAGPLLPG